MRLIDADELIKRITTEADEIITDNAHAVGMHNGLELAKAMVLNAPTIDAQPVKHGRWIDDLDVNGNLKSPWIKCSLCGCIHFSTKPNYCPHCGAIMDKENPDD